ncbi:MAG: peptide chain release factor N(5)-glutamine methyltransferase [Deltaproteobacteria bacterium]|nr:MAG: peptide chain release factor N(5)-glutamine methyltransferase [Deltaproteobacteria bacterium]
MSDWTPLSLIQWTAGFFEKKGIPNPRLDAELLLSHVLKCKRIDLYMQFEKIISEQDRAHYKTLIERRATREPLQYIIGETEFWGLKIQVTPDVLIPRPETELLVEKIVERLKAQGSPLAGDRTVADETQATASGERRALNILEIGTGSGCISIALAKNIPEAKIIATDISPKALNVARQNIQNHALDTQITLLESDLAPWDDFEKMICNLT